MNVRTGTPSNPSEALENVGIVVLVGPILPDTDDAVEEEVVVGGPTSADTDDAVEGEVVVGGPILADTDDAVEVVMVGGRR